MKILLFLPVFLLLKTSRSAAQEDSSIVCEAFTLAVHIDKKDTGRIMLLYFGCDGSGSSNKANLKNGKVTFSGQVNRATEALLFTDPDVRNLDDSSVIRFIIEPVSMSLACTITDGKAYDVRISGSVAQSQKDRWDSANAELLRQRDEYGRAIAIVMDKRGQMDSLTLKREIDRLSHQKDSVYGQLLQNAFNYIIAHPDSYFGGYLLNKFYTRMPIDTLKQYYSSQNQVVKNSYFGKSVLNYLYSLSGEEFRQQNDYLQLAAELKSIKNLFDVTLADASGKPVSLSKFKGRPTLLFFWGSWCGPCHRQAPLLKKLMEEKQMSAFNLVSISLNTSPADWLESMRKFPVPGVSLIDTKNILRVYYRFLAVPRYILVDAGGTVIDADAPQAGSAELRSLLQRQVSLGKSKSKL